MTADAPRKKISPDTPVLQVNYDESEPLHICINFCPMCGRNLRE